MAFVKKTWKDRIVQYANRRLLTKSGGEVEQVTVTRDEGTISEAGDQFNASNMNDLEQRVDDGFDDLNAADLPITSGSATNTKDYIDSGLSGLSSKQDIVSMGAGSSLNANDLCGSKMTRTYRCVNSSISNCPQADGTLMVFSNGDGYSTVQMFISSGGGALYIRTNWGAGSVSWGTWKTVNLT